MDNVLHAERLGGRVKRLHRRKSTNCPRRIYCTRWSGLRRSWRHTPTLDSGWLRCSRVPAAPRRCRRAHPASNSWNPVSWL
jgi:hypothetical protein